MSESSDDLSAVAWVHEELRRSLDAAHKALRRFIKDGESVGGCDIDVVDPSVLRGARAQLHQGVGALELVGLPAAALVLRASEAAVQRAIAKPEALTAAAVGDIERLSYALLDYLARMLAGKAVSPLSLFPQYRAVQEAAEAHRVHPADLWSGDWRWRVLPADSQAEPHRADAAVRDALEGALLALMRGAQPLVAAGRIGEICAGLGAGATDAQVSTLWKLAAAVFEAHAQGLLPLDVFGKRIASRLLAQFRILERGDADVSERLARDLLFFCAQSASPGSGLKAPRLAAVRQAYDLAFEAPTDYSVSALGRYDPALIAHARKRVAAAKEAWSAVAAGEMHRLAGLAEQFALVGDSLKRLFPLGETFADELHRAVLQTQQSAAAPPAALAMEVATSLLYIEAALEDADFDHPEHADRVHHLAERLAAVREHKPAAPLEAWMEELYRRVSERQTMGSVVQELRASLAEVELHIDQFFRNPVDLKVLIPVPQQLASMRGVLSVLGIDQGAAALLRMRDEIDALASAEDDAQQPVDPALFDRLAGNLSALGFMIDMLGVQPQMVKSLFGYDAQAGTLSPVMGRSDTPAATPSGGPALAPPIEQRLIEQAQMLAFSSVREDIPLRDVARDLERLAHEAQAADQPGLAATVQKARQALDRAQGPGGEANARGELSEALVDFVATVSEPVAVEPEAAVAPRAAALPTIAISDFEDDDEMRDIFLEEAREVMHEAAAACAGLVQAPDDLALLTSLRRAFHTLKGSSRMVGLKQFGEAAWVCEQIYNTHLADQRAAEPPLLEFTGWTLDYLGAWIDDIGARRSVQRDEATVRAAADRLGAPLRGDVTVASDVALPLSLPLDLPSAADLDLGAAATTATAATAATTATGPVESVVESVLGSAQSATLEEVSFDLDLSAFDTPAVDFAPEFAAPAFDPNAHAMFDPFDLEPSAPMPLDAPTEAVAWLDSAWTSTHDEPLPSDAIDDEQVKRVGALRIGIPLFNIYLNEADELSRRLSVELAEWAMELHRPIGEMPIALAHSLAGSSATVGFADLSQLARSLEHALTRSQAIGHGTTEEAQLFAHSAEEIRRLLHQFAAGFLKQPAPELLTRLAEHELSSALRLEAVTAAAEFAPAEIDEEVAPAESAALPLLVFGASVETSPVETSPVETSPAEASLVETSETSETSPFETAFIEPLPLPLPLPLPPAIDELPQPAETSAAIAPPQRPDALGLAELKPLGAAPFDTPRNAAANASRPDGADEFDAVDAVDPELFGFFQEEGLELLPRLAGELRDWLREPEQSSHAAACMRTLHTLKGGARLAGAMRLGEMAHRLETHIERIVAALPVSAGDVEALQLRCDAMAQTLDALGNGDASCDAAREEAAVMAAVESRAELPASAAVQAVESVSEAGLEPEAGPEPEASPEPEADVLPPAIAAPTPDEPAPAEQVSAELLSEELMPAELLSAEPMPSEPISTEPAPIDWTRFAHSGVVAAQRAERSHGAAHSTVRVQAPLLDRLVNLAGEVSIARSRIEVGVTQIKGSMGDLSDNLERLRVQLREIELQGEMQMTSRLEAAKVAAQSFDPLEFDRFTRFQELTRMMAESVNDVATVQRTLQRALESTEDELVAQARMTRDLQDDLLRTRMVEFEGLSDRLYRVVRLAAKETGKQVRLDIVGGSIEIDRGVLDRMLGAFEHLLRNCVTHGIEAPAVRAAAGKDPVGAISVTLAHEGNEVGVEFRDDGAGLDLARIRAKGVALGLLAADSAASDAELANLIFTPGFTTLDAVTELAGRGVGMDVVRSEVIAMGGRIETSTATGAGTAFKLILPLTTAVTQVVMLRCGATTVAVPSTLVEIVRRVAADEVDQAYASGVYLHDERALQFFWLGALLQISPRGLENSGRTRSVVVVRSAQQRIAIHVDEVLGNQEVVVKNLGPQLSRLPGLAGMTLLPSGAVALIYNPVALATLYGAAAHAATHVALRSAPAHLPAAAEPGVESQAASPLVLVVDDSLTVRRVTQRLLLREGYRVVLAKDGLDALERLAEELPQVVLSDIEMPRMDGFDLLRNIRSDLRWRDLPVVMITSRIAQKHRDLAIELGVDHYLGKPYSEEDLLALLGRYCADPAAV